MKQILKYYNDAFAEIMKLGKVQDWQKPLNWFDAKLEAETGDGWFVDPGSNTVKFLLFLLTSEPSFLTSICKIKLNDIDQIKKLGPFIWAVSKICKSGEKYRQDKLPTGN